MRFTETVGIWLAVLVLVCLLLLLWQNIELSFGPDLGAVSEFDAIKNLVNGIVEVKLIELTIGILVIFSIAANLFASGFQRRLDRMVAELEVELRQSAEDATKNSYRAANANIFHELAFQVFERIDDTVILKWHGKNIDTAKLLSAQHAVTLGLHYARSGLNYLEGHKDSATDSEIIRRVPGHLRNSFLWLSAAKIILECNAQPEEYYRDHFNYAEELKKFILNSSTPDRPRWYQGYESMAFFMVAYGQASGDQDVIDEGLALVRLSISGKVPKFGFSVPDAKWIETIQDEYKGVGYDV